MRKIILLILGVSWFLFSHAQDVDYVRIIVDTLSSSSMHGRGYVNNGDKIAADFIQKEFVKNGLKCFEDSFQQKFPISINTFPETIEVKIDQAHLVPGKDFVLFSSSPSVSGTFELVWYLTDSTGKLNLGTTSTKIDFSNKVLVTDMNQREYAKLNSPIAKGVIFLMEEKVWWHVSNGRQVKNQFSLQILKDRIPSKAKSISIKVENKYFESYETQNVVAYIPGKLYPDSFFVFTAHYDHLGRMGADTYFPGANDNASGTAMLLDLAHHYSLPENQPDCSIAFMAFSAEEVGLLGSGFYVSNPLFPLENIKFLINLDMVGSGSEGIKVVNGSVFKEGFERMVKINDEYQYLLRVSERGEAANSDHYPFYRNGVPCFFIYTLGKECQEYHNIYDTPENVPFTNYMDFFKLLIEFESTF